MQFKRLFDFSDRLLKPQNKTVKGYKVLIYFTIILASLMGAKSYGQRVTLKGHETSLLKVMNDIKTQTGYSFFYNKDWLQKARPVDIDVQDVELNKALDVCFANQPFSYAVVNKTIVLRLKQTKAEDDLKEQDNTVQAVRGIVMDGDGNGLGGASVTLKRSGDIVLSNSTGMFELGDVKPGDFLLISYVGYLSSEVEVPENSLSNFMYISLKPIENELDKAIVEAYGTTSRRFNVGAISTVDAETISKQPVLNPLEALQGQVPGLAVTATSGVPGAQVLMQVRGQNTISGSAIGYKPYDQPLIIIDGVPFATQNNNVNEITSLATASNFSGGISQMGGISPFANINPSDIESISVLKDADATSIYGTQGANGVILITTKKGQAGKTKYNLSINTAASTSASNLELLNTQQYLKMRKDAFAADGLAPSDNLYDPGYAPDLTVFDQSKYTNWQNTIYGKTAHNTDIHGTVSGGNANTTFLFSGGYTNNDFNYPGDFYNRRWTLHSSLHHSSQDKRFTLDLISDFGFNKNNSPGSGGSILLPPNLPDLMDPMGNLLWEYEGIDLSSYQFYSYLKKKAYLNNYNQNYALQMGYKIWKGLRVNVNMGYNRNTSAEHSENPKTSQNPQYGTSSAIFSNSSGEALNIEPQLNYEVKIGRGMLSALLGGTYKKVSSTSTYTQGYGYSNDNLLNSINGASTITSSDNGSIYKYSAGFGRLKYIYDQRYILSLTGRRDASSNFGPGKQFGNFGSVGAGWIFSEESGFKKSLSFINYGKLSGSYGTSGSDDGAAYQFQPFWSPNGSLPPFEGVRPSLPQNLFNPDYSWPLKKALNLSLDLGFLDNRILVNATYYRDREGEQLAGYPLPIQTGFTSVYQNLPATVENQGWEFALNTTNIQSSNFNWRSNFNITFNRNKLIEFPNLESSTYSNQYVIGMPTSVVLGFKYKGVNPETGLFEFYDHNGNVTSTPISSLVRNGGDMVAVADREVKFMGGFGNTLSYKGFSLYVFFQFSSQNAPSYLQTVYQFNTIGTTPTNEPTAILGNYWTKPGDVAELQRLTAKAYGTDANTAISNFTKSDGIYVNDTYVRLKTVSLSYALPTSVIKKLHIQGCSAYINAQNLLTFTNYKVGDPESFSYLSLPIQRTIACGLNFDF